jgi:hypothetical protein
MVLGGVVAMGEVYQTDKTDSSGAGRSATITPMIKALIFDFYVVTSITVTFGVHLGWG